ncbi:glyoxalase [Leptolyngbya sp. 'hensonii']|uniref:VOC family protein n=1 Tax=Leptolyngbya sp. 'hensonii' TaxID=1922337 RepID=UPI00094FC10D|nr:VOC family protein [Leptolyngbya sp. 'hensonii']OLP17001.1 glyoxalase [Leptolyngbya sp. 'hensonii']
MTAQFRHIMLMVKDVSATVQFYHQGLGLPVIKESPTWAELDANGTTIALHGVEEDPDTGSSPILSFVVEDVHGAIAALEALGGQLEGRVREPFFGKVAAVRTPEGHLVSLLQPATTLPIPQAS